jgi:hypothetical protein
VLYGKEVNSSHAITSEHADHLEYTTQLLVWTCCYAIFSTTCWWVCRRRWLQGRYQGSGKNGEGSYFSVSVQCCITCITMM